MPTVAARHRQITSPTPAAAEPPGTHNFQGAIEQQIRQHRQKTQLAELILRAAPTNTHSVDACTDDAAAAIETDGRRAHLDTPVIARDDRHGLE